MKIVVCVKQIPVVSKVVLSEEKPNLNNVEQIVNPFDEYAIEEALALKEKYGGEVIAISLGSEEVEKSLRYAVSVGVDQTILIKDDAYQISDTLRTSHILAKMIQNIGEVDIVLSGKVATDGNSGQIPPSIASWLNWPQLLYVKKIESINDSKICVWRLTGKSEQKVQCPLPVVLSVVKEVNEPRLPTLKGKMAAKKHEIKMIQLSELNIDESITNKATLEVVQYLPKKDRAKGELISGEPEEVVDQFIKRIQEEKII